MIETGRPEELSISYMNAVCAYKFVSFTARKRDDDGIDALITKQIINKKGELYRAQIDIQLKSTSKILKERKSTISYPLKKKNYDDLRRQSTVPSILCLLVLPNDEKQWLSQTINELIIQKCMYWMKIADLPESANISSVTIHIKKQNVITPDTIIELLEKVAEDSYL